MTIQTFCHNCGAALIAGAEFCGACGTRVSGAGTTWAAAVAAGGEYAGFWQRLLAYFIDSIIVVFVAGIPAGIVGVLAGSLALFYVVYIPLTVLYFAWGDGSGGTWGKQVLNIGVASLEGGGDIGLGRGFARAIIFFLGAIPLYLGWFWMLWDEKKQTWHDKAAGSVVVKTR
jgi:uncharacterized RDD family membrane protein YckC